MFIGIAHGPLSALVVATEESSNCLVALVSALRAAPSNRTPVLAGCRVRALAIAEAGIPSPASQATAQCWPSRPNCTSGLAASSCTGGTDHVLACEPQFTPLGRQRVSCQRHGRDIAAGDYSAARIGQYQVPVWELQAHQAINAAGDVEPIFIG